LLKSIQRWLHNNFLKKYGFGWLYRDFLHFRIPFDRCFCSLTPPLFIESLYQTRKVRCHVFVCYEYWIASFYDFAIWFWTVPTMWYFLFFIFIKTRVNSPPTIGNGYLYFVYVLDLLVHTFFWIIWLSNLLTLSTRFYDNSRGLFCLVYGV
jgi:hypothetical protein